MVRLLIAEDDENVKNYYKKILNSLGFESLYFVSNGETAIKKFKELLIIKKKPDVILMDYHMPIKNGLDASKEILEIDNTAVIIFISGDNTIKNKVLEIGVYEFLNKPFNLKDLKEILIKAISKEKL